MTDSVITATGLRKRYGQVAAVDGIDLNIRRGEIFGLLGPNGAGKTTTILMLLGLTEVSEGKIDVGGFDPMREPLEVKRRVGYLPDSVGFYDNLTARQNLFLASVSLIEALGGGWDSTLLPTPVQLQKGFSFLPKYESQPSPYGSIPSDVLVPPPLSPPPGTEPVPQPGSQ